MRCFQSPMAVDADLALQPCCPHAPRARNWHSGGPCRFWQLGPGGVASACITINYATALLPTPSPFSEGRAGLGPRGGASCASSLASFSAASGLLLILQLDPRRFGQERFVRSSRLSFIFLPAETAAGTPVGPRPPPQPSPNCKEPRRASAHPPEVPLGPQGRATVSQAKLASSPMSQRGLP